MKSRESNDLKNSKGPTLPHERIIGKSVTVASEGELLRGCLMEGGSARPPSQSRATISSSPFLLVRQASKPKPEFSNRGHGGDEVPQVAGLAHIAVRSQLITAHNVL